MKNLQIAVHRDGGRNIQEINVQKSCFEQDRLDLHNSVVRISKELDHDSLQEFSFCEESENKQLVHKSDQGCQTSFFNINHLNDLETQNMKMKEELKSLYKFIDEYKQKHENLKKSMKETQLNDGYKEKLMKDAVCERDQLLKQLDIKNCKLRNLE